MISFKQYLHEYLTPEQRTKFSKTKMSAKARKATDHFFGKDNDKVVEDVKDYDHDKSEIHRAVEHHIGKPLSVEEYKSGLHTDKHGRQAKIGKQIKDKTLLDSYANDSTRKGLSNLKKPTVSIHRGTEVAGQTNSKPDELHPTGHSWGEESCKNVDSGCNNHYLKPEIKHGSVMVLAHDHDGKEIYRATLHPHHNDAGHTTYGLDSEYGLRHPAFTAHVRDVAKRLSGEHKGGSIRYTIHPNVYNNLGAEHMTHPKASSKDVMDAMNSENIHDQTAAIKNPQFGHEHIEHAIEHGKTHVVHVIMQMHHPKITPNHITKALQSSNLGIRVSALESKHPSTNSSHIDQGISDPHHRVRELAAEHPKAEEKHITTALDDKDPFVRLAALSQKKKLTYDHLAKAESDSDPAVSAKAKALSKEFDSQ